MASNLTLAIQENPALFLALLSTALFMMRRVLLPLAAAVVLALVVIGIVHLIPVA